MRGRDEKYQEERVRRYVSERGVFLEPGFYAPGDWCPSLNQAGSRKNESYSVGQAAKNSSMPFEPHPARLACCPASLTPSRDENEKSNSADCLAPPAGISVALLR